MPTPIPFEESRIPLLGICKTLLHNQNVDDLQEQVRRAIFRLNSNIDRQAEAVVLSLGHSIESRDPLTQGHSVRLVEYTTLLGERVGLDEEELATLRVGSLIHDIGKVAVPDAILLKPGPLTASERAIIEQHPIVGESICAPLESLRDTLPIIRHHHEHMDGTGYPDGLCGDEIPLSARILQVADIYDALTSNRPYRKALSPEEALTQLSKEADAGWVDRLLVDQFKQLIQATCEPLSRDRSMIVDYFS
jgi:putative two-component system response regulator